MQEILIFDGKYAIIKVLEFERKKENQYVRKKKQSR